MFPEKRRIVISKCMSGDEAHGTHTQTVRPRLLAPASRVSFPPFPHEKTPFVTCPQSTHNRESSHTDLPLPFYKKG